jgi:hypothetical protein
MGEYDQNKGEYNDVQKRIPYTCLQCRGKTDWHDSGLCESCRRMNGVKQFSWLLLVLNIQLHSAVMSASKLNQLKKEAVVCMIIIVDVIIARPIFRERCWLDLMVKQRQDVHAVLRLGWRESMSVWVWKDWRREISKDDFGKQRQEFEEIYR